MPTRKDNLQDLVGATVIAAGWYQDEDDANDDRPNSRFPVLIFQLPDGTKRTLFVQDEDGEWAGSVYLQYGTVTLLPEAP